MNKPLPNFDVLWPARTNEIPKEVFVRPDLFELELQRIFYGPEWHPVAHIGELPDPGDFKTFFVGKVPLIINRGQDGQIRVFYNACAHRGNQLETAGAGNKSEFECPYHRWLFSDTGNLIGCPAEAEFTPGFSRDQFPLAQPRMDIFCGLIFVTFSDKAPGLNEFLDGCNETLATALGGDERLKLLGYQKVRYRTNWKAYNDNDGYHGPLLHTAFRMLNFLGGRGRQYATRERGHTCIEGELTVPPNSMLKDHTVIEFHGTDAPAAARVVELFPTFVVTKHLDSISLRFAIVHSVDEVEVHYAYFSHLDDSPELAHHRMRQSSNLLGPCGLISMEDASVFHRVHIGNNTPGNVVFQKGVKTVEGLDYEVKLNDETGNIPRWEYYRRVMGFQRQAP